jgi:tetratricopeptide (TPR) repeat protein
MIRTSPLLTSLFAAATLCACQSLNLPGRSIRLEEAAGVLSEAEKALASGDSAKALERSRALLHVEGLPTSQRSRITQLFAAAAAQEIQVISASPHAAEELADFVNEELPREIAVAAGIASARSFIALGEAEDAWKILRRLDERFPLHHERATAGRLLLEAGISLSHDERSWWIFWSARDEGLACLEYLVLIHPSQPRCDEAYLRLGEMYAEDDERSLAIERYSDLVLYHSESRLRPLAQARIPMLRLELLDSPEYDRNGLLLALAELDDWVIRFPTHSGSEAVLLSRLECLRRLSASDLGIARFYERIGNPDGRIFHAERAHELAHAAGDADLAASAIQLLPSTEPTDS